MRSIVGEKFTAARDHARAAVAVATRAPHSGGGAGVSGNPLGLGTGGAFAYGNKRHDLTQHVEQYRHNTGWVAASVSTIAKRIARQPIRLARVKGKAPEKAMPGYGRKSTTFGTMSKPWERAANPAAAVWFKRFLPAAFKALAPTAELLDTHPILDAIDDPNPIMVRWSLIFVTIASLLLTGKSYWWVKARERDDTEGATAAPNETPRIEIWPLPSSWVRPVHTEDRLYASWEVTPEGGLEPTPVPAEQIIYFYVPDPSTPLGAQSTLQNHGRAVISDEAISEAQRRAFANGVFPGVAVVVGRQTDINGQPGERPALNREQRAQIMAAFKQAYRGVYNSDEPIILDQIIQDIKRVTNTNAEMAFMESGGYTKDRITQGFGVNPISMGQVEGSNRAASATADDHLCQNTVNPLIELFSETISAWMNPLFAAPDEKLLLFIEEAHAVDPDSDRQDWDLLARYGATNRDELRSNLRNLPPMIDGDTMLVPGGMIALDARLAADVPHNATANPPKPIGGDGDGATDGAQNANPAQNPPANGGDGPRVPVPAPAQNSEPAAPPSGASVLDVLDCVNRLAARGMSRESAADTLAGVFPKLTGDAARRLVAFCTHHGSLRPVASDHVGEFARLVRDALQHVGTDVPDVPGRSLVHDVPDVRQQLPFDCGAAAGYSVAQWAGLDAGSYADFMTALDTEEEVGTEAADLFAYFAHHGCDPRYRDHWTVGGLIDNVRAGRVALCPVQYFQDGSQAGAEGGPNEDGHWVVVCGVEPAGVVVQCPVNGRFTLSEREFVANWFDRGQDGRPYVRYALTVGRRSRSVIDPPQFDPDKPERGAGAYDCKMKRRAFGERVERWEKAHADASAELADVLRAHFDDESKRILAALPKALKAAAAQLKTSDLHEFKGSDDEPHGDDELDTLARMLDDILPLGPATERLRNAVRPALDAVATGAAQDECAELEPQTTGALDVWVKAAMRQEGKVDRKPLAKPVRARVNAHLDDMVNDPYWADINKTTRVKMARAVRRGVANNETVESIQDRVRAVLSPVTNATRAEMIARTEATAALNVGFQAGREHYGPAYVKGKAWTANPLSGNVRPTHRRADGQTRKNGSQFRVGGFYCQFPGDPALPPKERCNCQCVALTIPAD